MGKGVEGRQVKGLQSKEWRVEGVQSKGSTVGGGGGRQRGGRWIVEGWKGWRVEWVLEGEGCGGWQLEKMKNGWRMEGWRVCKVKGV